MKSLADMYLHLMKLAITDSVYNDLDEVAHKGFINPTRALSMIGIPRLDNVIEAARTVIAEGIPGDFIETGCWRGGSTMLMRAALTAFGDTERRIWVADSFEGLPKPDVETYPIDAGDEHHTFTYLAVSIEEVKASFKRFDLLDDRVHFLKGWFRDTIPTAPIEQLAILRLDGDMYESTIIPLEALYPKVSRGGYVIVDDYGCIQQCRTAVNDYRKAHGIVTPLIRIDSLPGGFENMNAVYWRVE
jgi:O-methyltransferase